MKNQGFSLIEILVSIAIFSVVMITAAGALLATIDANPKAQAIQLAMNNLGFALESMSRVIREGNTYHCDDSGSLLTNQVSEDCNVPRDGGSFFAFKRTSDGATVYYKKSGTQIVRVVNGVNEQAITAFGVKVTKLTFYVSGSDDSQKRAMVTIVIQGTAGETAKVQTPFNLQTTLSQRMP